MYAVERLSSYISRGVYTVSGPFHPFGGAVDIIVVQQQDGSFKSSPWYVRFGKFQGVLKTKEKIVNISVNGAEADFHMYLDHKGEAYFLTEVEGEEGDFSSSSGEETDDKSENGKLIKTLSLNIDDKPPLSLTDIDMGNGKVLTRTDSKRSRILGLMFGRKSMKEDSMHWKGEDNVGRVSSLDSAKIAADLLEVKWSTDLKAHRRQGASTPQPSDLKLLDKGANKEHMGLVEEDGKDSQADKNQKYLGSPVVNDNLDHSAIGLVLHENVEVTEMYIMKKEYSDEIISPRSLFTGNHEQAVEGSISESNYLLDAGEMCHKEPTRKKIEVNAENERPSQEENGREVSSFVYFEATETSTLGTQDSNEKSGKVPPSGLEEVEVHAEALISELSSQPESVALTSEKISGGFDNIESYISNSVETKVVEVIHQTSVVEGLIPDKTLETDQKEILVNQTQVEVVEFSSPNLFRYDSRVDHVDTSTVPNSGVVDQIMDSYKEGESGATCTLSHLEDPHGHPQKVGTQREEEINELDISSEVSVSPQEPNVKSTLEKVANSGLRFKCSEEDHILFSDTDKVQAGRLHNNETDSQLAEYNKEEDHWLNDISHNSPLSSSHQSFESPLSRASASYTAEFVQESFSHESLPEEPRTPGISINIPRSWFHSEEVEKLLGSLPINRTHIHDVERSDSHRSLSRSLDLTLENSNWDMLGDFPNVLKPSASESNLSQVMSPPEGVKAMGGAWLPQEDKYVSTNFPVEMSLCKHLLSEGMGAEAASQAFDSEKLNLEKFTSLGPSVVKNDRLIVRISGRYFPWESAASIILGRAAFGKENIFEPEGAIAVEQVEKPLDEGSIPSGGSWRLWPFNFGKSKSLSLVPTSPDITKGIDGEFLSIDGDCNTLKTRTTKKKVPSIVPTSDQLASLNLKEGRNVITFTFSTAMLGRQQVDARIYLWKWNTRIVISDVDGTITRSDVLGQFMPLVGKDWSQTGVAHLFSAIKENGYQLLFLSARAISQAYLTRQFLFNLKQDGKVLPDGPVVISPDGLFPSLYREVIRRAPHEFKIACLEEIRALFPLDCNPFYAGFGNRDTDEVSYLKVGIPKGKIFIINPKGEVVVNRRLDTKSYTSLHSLVNGMFPAMSSSEQEDFNSWNYWKMPLPEINI